MIFAGKQEVEKFMKFHAFEALMENQDWKLCLHNAGKSTTPQMVSQITLQKLQTQYSSFGDFGDDISQLFRD